MRSSFSQHEDAQLEDVSHRSRRPKAANERLDHGEKDVPRGMTGENLSILTNGAVAGRTRDVRRAEMLTQMQSSHGNSYVNEFIGNQIIAARGHGSPPATGP